MAPGLGRDTRRLPAEAGAWIFIGGELAVFAFLFGAYLVQRDRHRPEFAESQHALLVAVGAANTLLLLTSSLFVVLAVQAVRSGDRVRSARLVRSAMSLGLTFIVVKVFEYRHEVGAHHTPQSGGFFLFYYVLTGLHLLHVVLGLGLLGFLLKLARRADKLTHRGLAYAEGSACFWHMVDLLWVILFPLLYLIRL